MSERARYGKDHFLRSHDPQAALTAYLEQQSKAYSRVKNAFVEELLGDLDGKRFLDYGCGAGLFAVKAAQAGAARVLGVDAEAAALSTAQYFAQSEGVANLCHFMESESFPTFPLETEFDVILIKDVLEHVENDEGLLSAAARLLAPAGRLVVSTQNAWSLNYLIEGTYYRIIRRDKTWCGWDPTHLRFYTPFSLHQKLRTAGLEPAKWRSVYLIPHKIPAKRSLGRQFIRLEFLTAVDRVAGSVFPYNRLGWNIIVSAHASSLIPTRVRLEERLPDNLRAPAILAPPAVTP
jgi:2-polyprenyl-6-hydroxyphenyl methylase/3-demethylubiquinone-9 3-methyltransferase